MRIALVLLVFVLLFGCVGEWRTIAQPKENVTGGAAAPQGPADSIGYLYVYHQYGSYGEEDWYDLSFTLEDENGNVVTAPGTLLVTIKDDKGNLLYTKQSTVSESDFEASEGYPFYDNNAYTHSAYFNEINKSKSSYANFTVEFTTDGRTVKKTKNTYLSYELVNSSGSSYGYNDDLKTINITSTKNGLQVTLLKGGAYGYYNDYRVELEFKNTGTKKKKGITITDSALVVGGNQYKPSSYYYDYELGNVYPGATLSKTLTFYDVEETSGNATLYLELEVEESGVGNQTVDVQFSFAP